jgi:hypothetical protein
MLKFIKVSFLSLVVLLSTSAVLTSCGKYEEGPGFSLRSRKGRLTGTWKITESKTNGVADQLDSDDLAARWIFEDNNTGRFTIPNEPELKFEWDFTQDDEVIRVTFLETGVGILFSIDYEIIRLTNKELWIKYTLDGDTSEEKFEKE